MGNQNTAALEKLQSIRKVLKGAFKERDHLIDAILVGMLSGKNVFAGGPPGTGKSALTNALCKAVGGKSFYALMGKQTTEDALFGGIDVKGIAESRYRRRIDGMLPDADIAFIDEVFKASSAVLNSTLSVLNERTYKNGDVQVQCPLMFAVGASNEIPEGEELAALYDRFTIRVWVDYVRSKDARLALLANEGIANLQLPSMTIEQVKELQQAAMSVVIPAEIDKVTLDLQDALEQNGNIVSDRKWIQARSCIRAYAFLNGRSQVETEDLEFFQHIVWDDPNDFKSIRKIILKVVAPLTDEINTLVDAGRSVYKELEDGKMIAADAHAKLKIGIRKLSDMAKKNPNNDKINEALETLHKINRELCEKHLGVTL